MSILETKRKLLDCLYDVFDQFVGEKYQLACKKGCHVCCTGDVVATTLEADQIIKALRAAGREDLLEKLSTEDEANRFRPKVTTNTLAMACLSRQEPPMEEPPADPGVCVFLENGECVVYEDRPFSCRGMYSTITCQPGGEAEAPPELVTIVTIIWQIIEHLDVGGLYGNLIDLILTLADEKNAFQYANGEAPRKMGVPPTKPVPGFLVPPDHEAAVQEFLGRLFSTECDGKNFRQAVAETRNSPF
jgi:Fe-S-cluster containining protein